MKKGYIITSLCLITLTPLFSQHVEFYLGYGIGKPLMTDLKHLQHYRLVSIDFDAKITDDFPSSAVYIIDSKIRFKRLSLSLQYLFASTGSRLSYKDYSGEIALDILANLHQFGPSVSYNLTKKTKFNFNLFLHFPILSSKVTFHDYMRLYDDEYSENLTVYSTSIGFEPGIEVIYHISKINLGIRVSHLMDKCSVLHKEGNSNEYLLDNKNQKVHTNWSGNRLEFLLGYSLF